MSFPKIYSNRQEDRKALSQKLSQQHIQPNQTYSRDTMAFQDTIK